jgi:hypothetical protein
MLQKFNERLFGRKSDEIDFEKNFWVAVRRNSNMVRRTVQRQFAVDALTGKIIVKKPGTEEPFSATRA